MSGAKEPTSCGHDRDHRGQLWARASESKCWLGETGPGSRSPWPSIVNLGLLIAFKYSNFLVDQLNVLLVRFQGRT